MRYDPSTYDCSVSQNKHELHHIVLGPALCIDAFLPLPAVRLVLLFMESGTPKLQYSPERALLDRRDSPTPLLLGSCAPDCCGCLQDLQEGHS